MPIQFIKICLIEKSQNIKNLNNKIIKNVMFLISKKIYKINSFYLLICIYYFYIFFIILFIYYIISSKINLVPLAPYTVGPLLYRIQWAQLCRMCAQFKAYRCNLSGPRIFSRRGRRRRWKRRPRRRRYQINKI